MAELDFKWKVVGIIMLVFFSLTLILVILVFALGLIETTTVETVIVSPVIPSLSAFIAGPSITTENAVVRWTSDPTQVKNSTLIAADSGALSIPGDVTIDGSVTSSGAGTFEGLNVTSGTKSMNIDISAIQDGQNRTLFMPNSDVNLFGIGNNVVTVPGQYATINAAIADGQFNIEVITTTTENQSVTSGLSAIFITFAAGVSYDWGDNTITLTTSGAGIFFVGQYHTISTSSDSPSPVASLMRFGGNNAFMSYTGGATDFITVFATNLDMINDGSTSPFEGFIVFNFFEVSIYAGLFAAAWELGSTLVTSLRSNMQNMYFYQSAGVSPGVVYLINSCEINRCLLFQVDEVLFTLCAIRDCNMNQSVMALADSEAENVYGSNTNSIRLGLDSVYRNSYQSFNLNVFGDNVQINAAEINILSIDPGVANLRVSECTYDGVNLATDSSNSQIVLELCNFSNPLTTITMDSPQSCILESFLTIQDLVINSNATDFVLSNVKFNGTNVYIRSVNGTIQSNRFNVAQEFRIGDVGGTNNAVGGNQIVCGTLCTIDGNNTNLTGNTLDTLVNVTLSNIADGVFTGNVLSSSNAVTFQINNTVTFSEFSSNNIGFDTIVDADDTAWTGNVFLNDVTVNGDKNVFVGNRVANDATVAGATCIFSGSRISGTFTPGTAVVNGDNVVAP